MEAEQLSSEADRAAASGEVQRAAALLQQAVDSGAADPAVWLKLAGMHRATGNILKAVKAVDGALSLDPLNFTALLMRASLLQRANHPSAGRAWDNALAQKPDEQLPPQIASVVAEGERHRDAWLAEREARVRATMAEVEARANDEERDRIERFRSNTLRRTKHFHSKPTHFHYPELVEREQHPRRLFPWIADLEAATEVLSEEFEAVMSAERAELVPYIQYDEHLPLDQWRALNHNRDWTAIHLWSNGERIDANASHCPGTMQLLEGFPQPRTAGSGPNAMFSLLAPRTHIPPHVGVTNTRLVCHLPLIVPDGCWFRVGAKTRFWKRGEALVFDDTIEHEAMNPSDDLRVVFIFDVWHPDLTVVEQEAVAALLAADGSNAAL